MKEQDLDPGILNAIAHASIQIERLDTGSPEEKRIAVMLCVIHFGIFFGSFVQNYKNIIE
ncbi:hypothetical protein NIES2135_05040 [Leptolyngbya boryana NIES-2135]|jgi:hypothetical protein|uniref:Uncharacterized protein n=1 Tax=Leptolyngbya boryana NIES-2135 TaxID=1973484 RepID=A0A1Z4JA99_LEPBY|nr:MULTISPECIES: hypothetical protein [Leptolyngbya]BAY53694.1 hypothetical protein NIES2135_05040 [Leptolyngbya boryana NIES-2135]MBD2367867.1 hypothetical protein [Leptolyngbya sp. FACHB-161]MBD2374285.1 hypothetical protein [Leptolyngbya sp. FACHB-238]MBD2398507.1 hypothetical protein [Leptolyngbya sp. FACHB-239]MBD2408321.1 hypothetical protein [Leptolyngbya sp. FACHB-402]